MRTLAGLGGNDAQPGLLLSGRRNLSWCVAAYGPSRHGPGMVAAVPALPDTERRTRIVQGAPSVGPFSVAFDVYGDGTDYSNWLEVWDDGVKLTPVTDWTLDSPSGSIGTLPRPITDARITFATSRSGNIDIVGARRPRRTTQLTEGVGENARSKNQSYTDTIAMLRELWDLSKRTLRFTPSETQSEMLKSAYASRYPKFDSSGNVTPGGLAADLEAGSVAAAASAAAAAGSATSAAGSATSAAASAVAAQFAAGFKYTWSTNTAATDPSAGGIKVNNAAPASATSLFISETDSNANAIAAELATWDDSTDPVKAEVKIAKDATNFLLLNITATLTDNGAWDTFTVSGGILVGSLANGDTVFVTIRRTGNKGADGTIGGSTGATDNRLLRADGTGGATVQNSTILVDDAGATSGITSLAIGGALSGATTITGSGNINSTAGKVQENSVAISPIGKQTIWVPAAAMAARLTNGSAPGTVEMTTNKNMFRTLDYDTTTQEFAQFSVAMPKGWNEGTLTFVPVWSHSATVTNFGVVWALRAVAISDDDAGDVAFGTEQTSTDTGGTTNDIYQGPESAAITVAGSPANNDLVMFEIKRNPADGADTLAVDARLHGVKLFFTTDAATDA